MKTRTEILTDAQKFYVSKGYGTLPHPLTPQSLANDDKFADFHTKYEKAYNYYAGSYPDPVISSHLSGIDFNHPVELVTIPSGQKHTQTQVAWGAKGNYYSTSDNTPQMMGIAHKGKIFDPVFVPPHLKGEHDIKVGSIRTKIITAIGKANSSHDEEFPELAKSPNPKQSAAALITVKSTKTFIAEKNVTMLLSKAKPITDTWSVPGQQIVCQGGGLQLYASHKENEKMRLFDFGVHDAPKNNQFNPN